MLKDFPALKFITEECKMHRRNLQTTINLVKWLYEITLNTFSITTRHWVIKLVLYF